MLLEKNESGFREITNLVEQSYGRAAQYSGVTTSYNMIYDEFLTLLIEEQTKNTYDNIFQDKEGFVDRAMDVLEKKYPFQLFERAAIFNVLVEGGYFFEHEGQKYNAPIESVW